MRYAMLALVLTAGLYSQTPPPRYSNQQTNPPATLVPRPSDANGSGLNLGHSPWEKAAQPPYAKWKIFPSDNPVTPAAPAVNLSLREPKLGKLAPPKPAMRVQRMNAPPSPCSIPLRSVPLPPSWPGGPTPEIRRVPMSNGLFPMREVKPPAPPCEENK